jgi:hypothetical protein
MLFKLPGIICIIAPQESGKSHMIKHILLENCKNKIFQHGICFTGSIENEDYSFLQTDYVIDGYNEDILRRYLKKKKEYRLKGNNFHSFIIFDDCMNVIDNSKLFKFIVSKFRHFNVTIIMATQYIMDIPKKIRKLVDYGIFFRIEDEDTKKEIFRSWVQMFQKYKNFDDYFINLFDEQYVCMIYKRQELDINKKYNKYKAPKNLPNFKIKF